MTGKEAGHIDHATPDATPPHANSLNPDALEVAPGTAHEKLEGWIPSLATDEEIRAALEKAFDYRGDVTITRKDKNGSQSAESQVAGSQISGSQITGYLFDRRIGPSLENSVVRLILANSNERPSIPYSDIAAIAFTGRDTAAGKSYEAWVKKYWEKRAKGETNISIEPEALE